ncbi:MAG: hypothetical protein M1818_000367 [Claussenomyces sp. TS43310]|nr:MAG: hypothetical protein M1818_000367 [Claussenomyces sp. TS43310]
MYISETITVATATISSSWPGFTALHLGNMGAVFRDDGDGSQLQRWSSFIGIITAIVGNILISFALNIQRYAHIQLHKEQEEEKKRQLRLSSRSLTAEYGTMGTNGKDTSRTKQPPEDGSEETEPLTGSGSPNSELDSISDSESIQERSYLKSPYWWAGILLMTVGETGNFLAYGFAPASIVSPLGVVALISNCVIAPIMLKERFRWRDFCGVVVAVGGAVTVVLSARQEEKKLGPHEVIGAITTTAFEIYMGVTFAMIVALSWASPRYGAKNILIDLGLVGLFGGYTALSTKGVASMLSSTLWKAFTTPITYVLIAILAFTAIMQVRYINKALQRFDSTQVIPVQFVLFTLSVIVGSAILYRDFEQATVQSATKFIGGCLMTFFGVFLITSGRSSMEDHSDDETDEECDERISLAAHGVDGNGTHYSDSAFLINHHSASFGSSSRDRSRRSSHVSFDSTSTARRPQSLRNSSDTSQTPSIRLTSADASSPSPSNPWKDSHDELFAATRPSPGLLSTTSSPLLPSEAQSASLGPPNVPPALSRTASQTNPQTHPNHQHGGPPPADISQRPVTPKHGLSRSMMPGPYISPLSSSFSAVVADTVRRGVDRKTSHRRPRLSLRHTRSETQHHASEENPVVSGTSPTKHAGLPSNFRNWMGMERHEGDELTEGRVRKGRSGSLSTTLGNLLRGKWQGRGSEGDDHDYNNDDDEEGGPVGQV